MNRPKSLFGRSPAKPDPEFDGAPEPEEEPLDEEAILAEEDLDHTGMGSLSGISIHRSAEGAAGPAAPASPRASPARSQDVLPRDVAEYWLRLRQGRRWPSRSDVDTKLVSVQWKNSLFMVVGHDGMPWRFESLTSDVMRGGGQSLTSGMDIEFNPMVMEWMLNMGRTAMQTGRPVENSDIFPLSNGDVRYRAVAVPLGETDDQVSHVLCHIMKG